MRIKAGSMGVKTRSFPSKRHSYFSPTWCNAEGKGIIPATTDPSPGSSRNHDRGLGGLTLCTSRISHSYLKTDAETVRR